jgi:two-component system, sensor histidine kinase and response regulator
LKYHILYIDDEVANLNVFKATFRRDYNIHTANSAFDGMEILKTTPIDLVITDQRMPKMTGVEFLKWCLAEYPNTIRIILTGFSDTDAIIKAINECDIYRYITKPWDAEDMKLALDKVFEVYSLRRDNQRLIADLKEAKESLEQKVLERTAEVTRQKEALELQNQRLQEIDNEKNNILSMVVHDLQSPVNRISGLIELFIMENKATFSENQGLYLDLIKRNISDAIRHIRNLLDTRALEGDTNTKMPLSKINLAEVLPSMIESYKEQAIKKMVSLHYESNASTVYINGHEDYVHRIFDNLISNAIKFSPKNVNSNITLQIKENGEYVRISVQDEGQGFTEEDKKYMFKKFQRLSATPTNGESSSGLGLSIVKMLTERLYGKVWAENGKYKGAIFHVEFPKYFGE